MPETLAEISDHKILTFGTAPTYLTNTNWLETAGLENGERREPVLRINNVYGLRRAVESGIGIASLPDYIVGGDSNLIRIDLPADTPEFDTYFVYPEELRQSKRVAVFRDFIVARAKEWKF